MIQLQVAERAETRIKLSIGGPSGSGKTCSALLLAYGLVQAAHPEFTPDKCWEKICIVDTENGSAKLYANFNVPNTNYHIGKFFTVSLKPPYEANKFIESIQASEQAGMEVVIIDSLSAYWTGEGGALDKQGKIAARTGNSYTAWRDVTPEYNRVIDTILQSSCHVIMCSRAKMEYVQEKNTNGKTVVRAVGMGLQTRDGLEYEASLHFMVSVPDHVANATKDRTGLFDGKYFVITPETGKEIYAWLSSGAVEKPELPKPTKVEAPVATESPAPAESGSEITMDQVDKLIKERCSGASAEEKRKVASEVKDICGKANYLSVTDPEILKKLYDHFNRKENA